LETNHLFACIIGNALQAKHINANNTDKKRYGVEDIAFFVMQKNMKNHLTISDKSGRL
jgi:hypothetical protein